MNPRTAFGVFCKSILEQHLAEANTRTPFHSVSSSRFNLARVAAQHLRYDCLVVDPENEETFIVGCESYHAEEPRWIYLRTVHVTSRTRYSTRIGDEQHLRINAEAFDAVTRCLTGWIEFDSIGSGSIEETLPRGEHEQVKTRLQVVNGSIRIDDQWFPIEGTKTIRHRFYKFLQELIDTQDYVKMNDHSLKTRDMEKQSKQIQDLFCKDSSGAARGFRIESSWFSKAEIRPN